MEKSTHKCSRCLKEFKFPYMLKKHLQRKFPCKEVEIKIPQLTSIYLNLPHNEKKQKSSICEFCNLNYTIKNKNRHLRSQCLKVPITVKKQLIEKYNKHKKNKQNQISLFDTNGPNDPNDTKFIQNNNINVNNKIINNKLTNNIKININPLGKENLTSLKEKDIITILNKAYSSIPKALEHIHFKIPENRNIYQPNINKPYLKYYNGKRWLSDKFEIISDKILSNLSSTLEGWFSEHQSKVKNNKHRYIEKMFNDCNEGKLEEKFNEEFKLFLMNYSLEIKDHIVKEINDTNLLELV